MSENKKHRRYAYIGENCKDYLQLKQIIEHSRFIRTGNLKVITNNIFLNELLTVEYKYKNEIDFLLNLEQSNKKVYEKISQAVKNNPVLVFDVDLRDENILDVVTDLSKNGEAILL